MNIYKSIQVLFLLIFLLKTNLHANDGVFYAVGNQLFPIHEKEISITKEILSIKRILEKDEKGFPGDSYAYITVDYTFFNASNSKEILVGFEAPSPSGDVNNSRPVDGKHPFIYDFTVNLNGTNLAYKTALVKYQSDYKVRQSDYIKNGQVVGQSERELTAKGFDDNNPNFYYVNYFKANFKKGKNTIRHTYKLKMSHSILEKYQLSYILTAATRWSNQQIDDFTLNINMGENEKFEIAKTFFEDMDKWQIENGRFQNFEKSKEFMTFKGGITFQKKNFKPKGELSIYKYQSYYRGSYPAFNIEEHHDLPKKIKLPSGNNKSTMKYAITQAANQPSYEVLRNLPYAIRGYVFKKKHIQDYYLTQIWYKPNPNYEASADDLNDVEKTWLGKIQLKKSE